MNILNMIKKDKKDATLNIRKVVKNNTNKNGEKHDG